MRAVILLAMVLLAGCTSSSPAQTATPLETTPPEAVEGLQPVFMAGTQPGDAGTFAPVERCELCHADYGQGEGAFDHWRGSMMANAARDPLFWALVAVQNKVFEEKGIAIGDYCLRCHVPKGWLEGRSEPADGSNFTEEDLHGVLCDVCHRMVDPLSQEGRGMVEEPVEYYRNAQFVVSSQEKTKLGPYDDAKSPGHATQYSGFHLSSEFCGTCHEITNPYYDFQVPVEKTYTEWRYSAFSREGINCQDCHMPYVSGYGCTTNAAKGRQMRDNIPLHQFVGGNAWMPLALPLFAEDLRQDFVEQLKFTRELAVQKLQEAAELEVTADGTSLEVRVTNLAGHRLPTGFTEGRRMWLNVRFYDASGVLVKESGAYDPETAELSEDPEIKVYEAKPGMKGVEGYPDGESFHFALNNHVYKDNRIPPRGFTNAEYRANGVYIVGAEYADGQNWDITTYTIPEGAVRVEVRLMYQTTTKEFVEFLRDENRGNRFDVNGAGQRIYEIWEKTGKAEPVTMASAVIEL
ncbi:MAG: hypothetical protein GXO65_04950 [Euryarchaeota archaeon]|nr:hypothetical protein [Euryarchaeota archaeon]